MGETATLPFALTAWHNPPFPAEMGFSLLTGFGTYMYHSDFSPVSTAISVQRSRAYRPFHSISRACLFVGRDGHIEAPAALAVCPSHNRPSLACRILLCLAVGSHGRSCAQAPDPDPETHMRLAPEAVKHRLALNQRDSEQKEDCCG